MKKITKPVLIWAGAGLLVLVVLIALFSKWDYSREKPVPVTEVDAPVSEVQKSIKTSPPSKMELGQEYRTGWTQLEDSIEISLSGPDNCLPTIEKASMKEKTVSIWLKETPDNCTDTSVVSYSTIDNAKDIENVEMYEAGYPEPFTLYEK
jgi:hypothetical protein